MEREKQRQMEKEKAEQEKMEARRARAKAELEAAEELRREKEENPTGEARVPRKSRFVCGFSNTSFLFVSSFLFFFSCYHYQA
jgi:hypothetical protein